MWRWLLMATVLPGQSFERDLQPVFRKHCYGCHAAAVKMGSLDVETHEGILRGGNQGPIVVAGKALESRLYLTLTGAMEPDMPMGGQRLAAAELDIVRRWIDAGARPDAAGLAWRGDVMATGLGGRVRLLPSGEKLLGTVGTVRYVAISADGKQVAAGGLGGVLVWEEGKALAVLEGAVEALAFLPDGRLAGVRGGAAWDLRGGGRLFAVETGLREMVFSPDGRRVAGVNAAGRVRLSGLAAEAGAVTQLAWDGDRIAAGMEDGRVRLLRASDLATVGVIGQPGGRVMGLAFGEGGRRLAVMREDGSVEFRDVR